MRRLLKQRGLFLGLVLLSLFILTPSARSYAFGIDLGEHCWTGDTSGLLIRHQVTKFGTFFNLNGTVTTTSGVSNPAYGTAFVDKSLKSTLVKVGYTQVMEGLSEFGVVHMSLDPVTLNGTKIFIPRIGPAVTETVTHIACP